MSAIPAFETPRLALRGVTLADAPAYKKHFVDYDIISQMSTVVPWPYPEDGVARFIEDIVIPHQGKDQWFWGIFLKTNPEELIGSVTLRRKGTPGNRGFWLGKAYWGRGIMSEAVVPVMDYAFGELGFEKLLFANALENIRSSRVKQNHGAISIRHEPAEYVHPEYKTREVWELSREGWLVFKSLGK